MISKFIVKSCLRFAIKIILAERSRLRSSQPCKAAKRYASPQKNHNIREMTNNKDIFLDKNLRTGGFYELAIQVCPSSNITPIEHYTDFIWSLTNVHGPYDLNFNSVQTNIENTRHNGMLLLDDFSIPFLTYHIRENEPIESGFNWFDICFYTAAIENVFGDEYITWLENPKSPIEIENFMKFILKSLYNIYPFQLATIDFEASGQYYLYDLKDKIELLWNNPKFYVGMENYKYVFESNKRLCRIVEEI